MTEEARTGADGQAALDAIKEVIGGLNRVSRALRGTKAKPGTREAAAKAAAELLASGKLARLEQALDTLIQQQEQEKKKRLSEFGAAEAQAVRSWRERGEPLRQTGSGWIVGFLEVQLDKPGGRAALLYNGQTLIPPEPIEAATGFETLLQRGRKLLDGALVLPMPELQAALWDAYLFTSQQKKNEQGAELRAVLEELPLALVRRVRTLRQKQEVLKLPSWALSWILDEAFRKGTPTHGSRRLALRTGTQRETRQMGVRVGPREPGRDSLVYCYVQDMPLSGQSPEAVK